MKTKTPFYELAEKYAEEKEPHRGVCDNLCKNFDHYDFFFDAFRPITNEERYNFRTNNPYWMESMYNTQEQDRADRITALLFADLLWQEEMKGGKK